MSEEGGMGTFADEHGRDLTTEEGSNDTGRISDHINGFCGILQYMK